MNNLLIYRPIQTAISGMLRATAAFVMLATSGPSFADTSGPSFADTSGPSFADTSALHVTALETDGDGAARLVSTVPGPDADADVTVMVHPERTLQIWQGTGAALTDSAATVIAAMPGPARARLIHQLFSTDGAGFSIVRLTIGASDFSASGVYDYEPRPGSIDVSHDLRAIVPVLHAVQRELPHPTLIAAAWSPPAWMKTTRSMNGGSIDPATYGALAGYLAGYAQQYRSWGLPIAALSPQNEPLLSRPDYPTAALPADQESVFVHDFLAPTLRRTGLGGVGILGLDHNWSDIPYVRTLATSPAAADLSGYAFHCYRGDPLQMAVARTLLRPNQIMMMTECSPTLGSSFAGGFHYDMHELVMGVVRNGGSGVVMWNLALDPDGGPTIGGCADCEGVATVDAGGRVRLGSSYYALAHVSAMVRPGAHVLAAESGTPDVEAIGFRNPDGSLIAIAYNGSSNHHRTAITFGGRRYGFDLPPNAAVSLHVEKDSVQ